MENGELKWRMENAPTVMLYFFEMLTNPILFKL